MQARTIDGILRRWSGMKLSDLETEDLTFMRVLDVLIAAGDIAVTTGADEEAPASPTAALADFMETI